MDQNKVFHGCFNKKRDGTNRVLTPGEKYITQTSEPFWKYPEDIFASVRTRSQEQKYQQQKNLPKPNFKNILKKNLLKNG